MKIGISLSTRNEAAMRGKPFVEAIANVEKLGFDAIWFFDAIGRGYLNTDAFGASDAAAAVTSRIEIGTCIVQVPLRHPVELAHRALTTHMLAEGRFLFGVGAGSTEGDFKAMDQDFAARFKTLRAALPKMQALWRGETVDGVNLSPWPAAVGGPPILIGSWAGSRWIPIAAKEYSGWIGSAVFTNVDSLKEGVARYKDMGGKRAIATNVHVDLSAPTTELADGAKIDLKCQPDEAAKRLSLLADAGFDDVVLVVHDHSEANLKAVRALI